MHKKINNLSLAAMSLLLSSVSCVAERHDSQQEETGTTRGLTYEQWLQTLDRVPDGPYLVEKDIALYSDAELHSYFNRYIDTHQNSLVIGTVDAGYGSSPSDDRWSRSQALALTYCVSSNFGSNQTAVRVNVANAAKEWSKVSFVNFVDLTDRTDLGACTNTNTNFTFNVELEPATSVWDGYAFLPSQPRTSRVLRLNPARIAGYNGRMTLLGVAMHEFGHILGFKHEHFRPEANLAVGTNCYNQAHEPGASDYRELTTYDSGSVMIYPDWYSPGCHGSATGDYVITAKDREGISSVYGGWGSATPPTPLLQSGTKTCYACSFQDGTSGNWHSGMSCSDDSPAGICRIGNGGFAQASTSSAVQRLSANPHFFEFSSWDTSHPIPPDAEWSGNVSTVGGVYVCRTTVNGQSYLGKLYQAPGGQRRCSIALGSAEFEVTQFEVLRNRISRWTSEQQYVPSNAVSIAPKSTDGYICNVDLPGGAWPNTHNGMLKKDSDTRWWCHIGNGGRDERYAFYRVLAGSANYTWVASNSQVAPPSTAVWGGWVTGVDDMFVCKVGTVAGKLYKENGTWRCSIGAGTEVLYST